MQCFMYASCVSQFGGCLCVGRGNLFLFQSYPSAAAGVSSAGFCTRIRVSHQKRVMKMSKFENRLFYSLPKKVFTLAFCARWLLVLHIVNVELACQLFTLTASLRVPHRHGNTPGGNKNNRYVSTSEKTTIFLGFILDKI